MQIKVTLDAPGLRRLMQEKRRQVDFATALALTRTVNDIRQAMPAALDAALDRPTPFTQKGFYVKAAKRDNLVAEVGFKDIQAKYMKYQVEGGVRKSTDAGIKMPGNIQLNTFGNIPKGMIAKLKAAAQNGQLAPAIARRLGAGGKHRKGTKPIQLFFGIPQGKGWENAPLGIWRRIPGENGGPGKLIPVIVFENQVSYSPRFDFKSKAETIVRAKFPHNFKQALTQALATAR